MAYCYIMLDGKLCHVPLLPREDMPLWTNKPITGIEISTKMLREKNQTKLANRIELYIKTYYDPLQLFQMAIGCWSIVIIILGIINIVPKHEDFKVITLLLVI